MGERVDRRRTVEEMQFHCLWPEGDGFKRALAEARLPLDVGAPIEEAAEHIGFTVKQLRAALRERTSVEIATVEAPQVNNRTVEIATKKFVSTPSRRRTSSPP